MAEKHATTNLSLLLQGTRKFQCRWQWPAPGLARVQGVGRSLNDRSGRADCQDSAPEVLLPPFTLLLPGKIALQFATHLSIPCNPFILIVSHPSLPMLVLVSSWLFWLGGEVACACSTAACVGRKREAAESSRQLPALDYFTAQGKANLSFYRPQTLKS